MAWLGDASSQAIGEPCCKGRGFDSRAGEVKNHRFSETIDGLGRHLIAKKFEAQ